MTTRTPRAQRGRLLAICLTLVLALIAAACGDDDDGTATGPGDDGGASAGDDGTAADQPDGGTVRLLTHDSFYVSDHVFEAFTEETGITVELIQGGDAGTVVNQAILTSGRPQADVLFGIDSTFLSRALDEDIFVPHTAEGLDEVDDALRLDPEDRVTPIDYGDVCLNYDRQWFDDAGLDVPASLGELTDPAYADLLVVQNPASSSPGLAFLLATIAELGEDGWQEWWSDLRGNGVRVVDGWEQAYNTEFSGGGASEGDRPLVVSYASSPPAEVIYAEEPIDEPPTGVIDATCYRQVEFAGILAGTEREEAAAELIDFMLSPTFQEDVPLSMFVFPARGDVELPEEFDAHAARPDDVHELDPRLVTENREQWIREWTDLVLR